MSDVIDMESVNRTFDSMFRPAGASDTKNNNDQGDQSPKDKTNEPD